MAICRLKRVAADYKDDITDRLPAVPERKNGKRIALVGAGPASLTVARDLAPAGYEVVIAASAQEQSTALNQVNTAVNQMDQVTQQNAALVEEASAAAHSMATQAQGLRDVVSVFKVGAR